jgi:hypothetical protein
MSINKSNDKNIPTDPAACSEMTDLVVGDLIELLYEDSPKTVMRATVSKILTDRDEGMGPEIEDYVACWFELDMTCVEGEDAKQIMILCTDFKYSLNGRHVTVRTCNKPLQTDWAVNHVGTKVLYCEPVASQEEIYLEETEEKLRAILISDDPSPSQNISLMLAENCGEREFDRRGRESDGRCQQQSSRRRQSR